MLLAPSVVSVVEGRLSLTTRYSIYLNNMQMNLLYQICIYQLEHCILVKLNCICIVFAYYAGILCIMYLYFIIHI